MSREYKLAADAITTNYGVIRREVIQITDDDHREVILVVNNDDAIGVLEAICRAYQDGREDRALRGQAENSRPPAGAGR